MKMKNFIKKFKYNLIYRLITSFLVKKFKYNLIYRLITSFLVCVMPLCIAAMVLVVMVLGWAGSQVKQTYQLQLDRVLQSMEKETKAIAGAMDEFVGNYITDLSIRMQKESEMTAFDMLRDLRKILRQSNRSGFVALHERTSGRILVGAEKETMPAQEMDELTSFVKAFMKENTWEEPYGKAEANGYFFLTMSFCYQNYDVVYWLDVGKNIADALSDFYDRGSRVFVYDTERVLQIQTNNKAEIQNITWENCTKQRLSVQTLQWDSQEIPLCVCIQTKQYIWQMIPPGYWLLLAVAVLCLCMVPFMWKLLRLEVIQPFEILTDAMKELKEKHLDYRIDNHAKRNSDEVQYLFDTFDEMAEEIRLSAEKDKKMYQTELDNLRLQVNPHMLLNSFNMIYSLAQSRNYACIQEYALHLVDYFRYALRKNQDMVPMYQELEFVQNYIEIQKIRFPNAFSSVYNIEETCKKALVPPLLVENFVENAMKYALVPGKVVEVLLNIRRQEDRLLISVCDTGRGIKPEILKQLQAKEPYTDKMGNKHIGVWNCWRRIEVFYGEQAEMNIISTLGEGTQVFVNIPFVEVDKDESAACR